MLEDVHVRGLPSNGAIRGWRSCGWDSGDSACQLFGISSNCPGCPEGRFRGSEITWKIMRSFDRKKMYSPEQYNSKSFSKWYGSLGRSNGDAMPRVRRRWVLLSGHCPFLSLLQVSVVTRRRCVRVLVGHLAWRVSGIPWGPRDNRLSRGTFFLLSSWII